VSLHQLIVDRINRKGPITFAEYMELALYHPQLGYYARAAQRSGREGDFYTSVDVGPLFGEMLARQLAEMWSALCDPSALLVEAGAGNGRLARDILDALERSSPDVYTALRLYLVERTDAARNAQSLTLGPHADKLVGCGPETPQDFTGILYANELLDAMPAHVVVMTEGGLREVLIDTEGARLVERTAPPSTPDLERYLARSGARLAPGWRAEVGLPAESWIRDAVRRMTRGFVVMIDYGHEAAELYSARHAIGTVRTFHRHTLDLEPAWLQGAGDRDITLDVNFTAIRHAAEESGAHTLGLLDQTYFLLGLGIADFVGGSPNEDVDGLKRRMRARTLMLPGGLGSSHKVLILGKDVGTPPLRGLSWKPRLT